jgi:uncharacterized membrane protein HdeD (DUF308 family)
MVTHPQTATVSLQSKSYLWILALTGIASILFGVLLVVWPGPSLQVLVYLFGAFAGARGILSLIYTFRAISERMPWWPPLFIGIIDLVAAAVVFAHPDITVIALVYVIAFWAILGGLFQIFASLLTARFLWALAGVLALAAGYVLLANPLQGGLAFVLVLGVFAIINGVLLLIDAFRAPQVTEWRVSIP